MDAMGNNLDKYLMGNIISHEGV